MRKARVPLASLGFLAFCNACGPGESDGGKGSPTYYEATGTIVAVEGDHVRIDHDEIEGFMGAMTMSSRWPIPPFSKAWTPERR